VYNPNMPSDLQHDMVPAFVNDSIVRLLAGVVSELRPVLLRVPFNGEESMRELTTHDPSLLVGVLGGGGGTTRDTFELAARAYEAGARALLLGRKINRAQAPLEMLALIRPVLSGKVTPEKAVRAYHEAVHRAGEHPERELEEDLRITEPTLRQR